MPTRDQIARKTAKVGVIGLGYVGLPLAVEFAKAGFHVVGIDVDDRKVSSLSAGRSYVRDVPSREVKEVIASGYFSATTDFSVLKRLDAVSICVPTPLTKTKDPDISYIAAATEQVARYLPSGQLVVLESTTYPGTTNEVVLPELAKGKKRVGRDFFLAFSPERTDPGNPVYATRNTPKIIGGVTPRCTALAVALYRHAVDTVIPVGSTQSAEMVKLLENTFRAINIGLANEVALMCRTLGIDVWEVIDAAATKPYGFMPFYPGPGLGGHCIPIDPLYLSWKLKTFSYNARFIELASEINTKMPEHVVELVGGALNRVKKSVNGTKLLILGVAYKRNVDDVRESPALDIIRLLRAQGARVAYSDPFVPTLEVGSGEILTSTKPDRVGRYDAVIIVTDHSAFDYAAIVKQAKLVVDTRNATKNVKQGRAKIVKL
ncbi:MAG: nucleotide sugar dehydrogenase [Nitrospirae bacterium]|nr:nucleotide sugar dehydrogenase [Nitrospirota bacterium]